MREHNRLCGALELAHSSWSNEERFWKARQIVIAKIQRITYEEWLPALMGSQINIYYTGVNKPIGESISAEFSVVAYRVGHSMIPDHIGPFQLPTLFFNAQLLVQYGIEPMLQAAFQTPSERVDLSVVDGLRNFMFSAGPNIMGEDLVTRNLFRAREVGITTYDKFKQCFNQPKTTSSEQESYVGLLSEPLVAGSSLPRTIAAVIGEQFRRLRIYDDNFYTKISRNIGSEYWREISYTTLSSVIEANTALTNIPKDVFRV